MPSITEIVNIYYTQDLLKEREKNKNIKKEKVNDKLDVIKINANDTQNKQNSINKDNSYCSIS
ncbi:hypothetical protein [Spiroplasma endosymbiont of Colias croceus]|uniref:hypothetical protein n=1 Tax=Spiroplasma endosymbiont of Colias croceus TaxID=3066310 RepID=UPI0030D4D832